MMKIKKPLLVYLLLWLALMPLPVAAQIGEGSAFRRYEVAAEYPPNGPALHVPECGLYGVVAERYEWEFNYIAFYGHAIDGDRPLVAAWPAGDFHFVRQLAEGEQWSNELRAVFEPGER
jgi:hypothetical protein